MKFSKLPLWTPCASAFLALAWLLPNANPPWVAFHKDAWIALVLSLVSLVLLIKNRAVREALRVDLLSLFFLLLSVAVIAQWLAGAIPLLGHAVMGASYFLAAAFAVVIGRAWEMVEPDRVGDFLFAAFLIAALGTALIMLAQASQSYINTIWINALPPGGRPYGNLVQPNNAAT
jgi:hypothetical protein